MVEAHLQCPDCARLLHDFERAIAEQTTAITQQRDAVAQGQPERADCLERAIQSADFRRAEARKQIAEHRWAAHAERDELQAV